MSDVYSVKVRIHTETLESNLRRILGDKFEKRALTHDIKEAAAIEYMKQLRPYVPASKTGDVDSNSLRNSAKTVDYSGTVAIKYDPEDKYGRHYGDAQFYGDDLSWNRYTPGTYSHWSSHISDIEKEVVYRKVAKLMIEAMNNGS